jgi:hypothetical protein
VDSVLEPAVFYTDEGAVGYLGLFNRSNEPRAFSLALAQYGLSEGTHYSIYDVTAKRAQQVTGSFSTRLEPQSFRLFVVSASPTVAWTSSHFTAASSSNRLTVDLSGPAHLEGYATTMLPRPPRRVLLDGVELAGVDGSGTPGAGQYRRAEGNLVTVGYSHDRAHRLDIEF